ncbi:uncharacterized protein SCHCODRAFT_02703364 [Schizophyllum commune H4-8]|nr:uncharacterized protein SCHCODRAFT_02703364 [Schizophyllum commune H4-8]KAI5890861.1 hypothetical protein SCHCODRAFT_02703364 [Schizophyllum commune H4-8]
MFGMQRSLSTPSPQVASYSHSHLTSPSMESLQPRLDSRRPEAFFARHDKRRRGRADFGVLSDDEADFIDFFMGTQDLELGRTQIARRVQGKKAQLMRVTKVDGRLHLEPVPDTVPEDLTEELVEMYAQEDTNEQPNNSTTTPREGESDNAGDGSGSTKAESREGFEA